MVLKSMRSAAKARWSKWEASLTPEQRLTRKKRVEASYKKEWCIGGSKCESRDTSGVVEWRGWLYEEEIGKEVAMGWCNKGMHYLAWHLRKGHLEVCSWRRGKLYGK